MNKFFITGFLCLLICFSATAQKTNPKWDVANPYSQWNYKEVPLNTDEVRNTSRYHFNASTH